MNAVDPTAIETQGCALLEEWPTRPRKRVSFSKYSNMNTYQITGAVVCYSRSERKGFQLQALKDADCIKQLMESCPFEGSNAIRYLLMEKVLGPENLLGIEHLVSGARKVVKERHIHVAVVLEAQRELNKAKLGSEICELKGTQARRVDVSLARVSSQRSLKSAQNAVLRATLAAN